MNSSYEGNVKLLLRLGLWSLTLSTIGYYLPLPNSIIKGLVVSNLLGYFILTYLLKQNNYYKNFEGRKIFNIFTGVILFSIFPAYFYWHQPFYASLISTAPFFLYGLFLLLVRSGIAKSVIHQLLISIALISLLLFYVKVLIPSIPIGRISDDPSRGNRISIPGIIFIWYLYFYYLGRCLNKKSDNTILQYLVLVLCVGVFFLQKGRSQIAVIGILSLIYYIKHTKPIWYKYLFLSVFIIGIGVIQASSIRELVNLTSTQMESTNPDQHVREIGMFYYVCEFPTKGLNFLIGNGIPSYGRSQYGNEAEAFAEETGIHLVDIGIVGIYNYWGLIGVILYVYIFFYFIFKTRTNQYEQSRYFLGVLFGQSIVSAVPLYLPPIAAISLGCYLLADIKK